jgi:hypothetical protein
MKHLYQKILVTMLAWGIALPLSLAQSVTLPQASPKASVMQTVGIASVKVVYSRPNVTSPQGQDRTGQIWGNVVPYGFNNLGFGTATAAPWRAGANENTLIELSHDASVEGSPIAAGTYSLHMALEETGEVIVILNKDINSWGSFFYEESQDALRVTVTSEERTSTPVLTYSFPEVTNNDALLVMDWDNKRIPVRISFDTPELVFTNLTEELKSSKGFTYQSWMTASAYLAQNNIHMDKALEWADNAIAAPFIGQKNFNTLQNKATILNTMGKSDEAAAVMEEALADPTAGIQNYYNYGRSLIAQGNKEKALELFLKASKKWPEHWLAPHGLARGYSATGDYKKALKYEKEAFAEAPETSKPFLEGYLKSLEEGKDFN